MKMADSQLVGTKTGKPTTMVAIEGFSLARISLNLYSGLQEELGIDVLYEFEKHSLLCFVSIPSCFIILRSLVFFDLLEI